MVKINMREFSLNIAKYMERAHKGESFMIMRRNKPIAEITPPHQGKVKPGWSLQMPKLKIKGLSMSQELTTYREEERS